MDQAYADTFEVHTVGSHIHQELWVPADKLEEFNKHIIGNIEIIAAYYGREFSQGIDKQTNLPKEV